MADERIRMRADNLELLLAPGVGGSIARLDLLGENGRLPVMRGADSRSANVLDAASFPLVPFCNRVRGGRFAFRGREVRLAANMAGDPSPLHGQGWLAAWEVVASDARAAELRFHHDPGEWPWAYEARQSFALDPDGLSAVLACRNMSDEPMPCGLGHHPYFPCDPSTRLDTDVAGVWEIDERVLPTRRVPAEGRYDLRDRLVCGQELDNGFDGWNGRATMRTPGAPFTLALSSPEARHFQLYSPPQGGLYVAEPVSHANAALNEPEERWADLGLRVLAPGEEMALSMRLDVVPA